MSVFTTSLPDELLKRLADESQNIGVPQNEILESALTLFLDEIKKVRYAKSYSRTAKEEDIMAIAEEGLKGYYLNLKDMENLTKKEIRPINN